MLILLKIFSSALAITVITEIAKKYSLLGGLLVALPINFLICILWLYFEKKDMSLLFNFSSSALVGLIPTFLFILCFAFFIKRELSFSFSLTLTVCIVVMSSGILFADKLIK